VIDPEGSPGDALALIGLDDAACVVLAQPAARAVVEDLRIEWRTVMPGERPEAAPAIPLIDTS
jgi:hypothetical protein